MPQAAITHVKEHKVPYLVSLLVPVLPLILAVSTQMNYIDNALQTHELTREHPQTRDTIQEISGQLSLILEIQLAEEIHKIMLERCTTRETGFDPQLERLQREYQKITGARYSQIPCASA